MTDIKGIAQNLLNFLKRNSASSSETPEGLCPNCWGREEYGGKFFERVKNHGLDVNSSNPEVGWITDYVEKHLSPISLQEENDEYYCTTCKFTYKKK